MSINKQTIIGTVGGLLTGILLSSGVSYGIMNSQSKAMDARFSNLDAKFTQLASSNNNLTISNEELKEQAAVDLVNIKAATAATTVTNEYFRSELASTTNNFNAQLSNTSAGLMRTSNYLTAKLAKINFDLEATNNYFTTQLEKGVLDLAATNQFYTTQLADTTKTLTAETDIVQKQLAKATFDLASTKTFYTTKLDEAKVNLKATNSFFKVKLASVEATLATTTAANAALESKIETQMNAKLDADIYTALRTELSSVANGLPDVELYSKVTKTEVEPAGARPQQTKGAYELVKDFREAGYKAPKWFFSKGNKAIRPTIGKKGARDLMNKFNGKTVLYTPPKTPSWFRSARATGATDVPTYDGRKAAQRFMDKQHPKVSAAPKFEYSTFHQTRHNAPEHSMKSVSEIVDILDARADYISVRGFLPSTTGQGVTSFIDTAFSNSNIKNEPGTYARALAILTTTQSKADLDTALQYLPSSTTSYLGHSFKVKDGEVFTFFGEKAAVDAHVSPYEARK